MLRRLAAQRRAAEAFGQVLGDVRTHVHRPEFVHEVGRVVVAVGAVGDRAQPVGMGLDHGRPGDALGLAGGPRHAGIEPGDCTFLHQSVAEPGELGLLAGTATIESGVGIGRRSMRLVGPLLAGKFASAMRLPDGGSIPDPPPSLGLMLFIDA